MMESAYDVTIIVRGKSGSIKVVLGEIPRERIFTPEYPEAIRSIVKLYETSIADPEE